MEPKSKSTSPIRIKKSYFQKQRIYLGDINLSRIKKTTIKVKDESQLTMSFFYETLLRLKVLSYEVSELLHYVKIRLY